MPTSRRAVSGCAPDDYGIAPGVNGAIRDLIARRRINATSVMVVAHAFNRAEAKALMDAVAQGKGFIGLHLVLTAPFNPITLHFRPLRDNAFVPQNEILLSGFLRRLDREIVQAEVEAQIIAFSRCVRTATRLSSMGICIRSSIRWCATRWSQP